MDNEYKVSWIDTNPQNLSSDKYVFKKHNSKKHDKKENVEDIYEKTMQNKKQSFLSKYELKIMLDSVLKSLPQISSSKLLLSVPAGFVAYLQGK